ncbi:MAG: ATP-binding cassette domain-containing protein [Bacteroidales bacterium]|nr:ATP-binding cassette domain-containing protein [Candidatus Cacconaster caballi]
MLRCESITKRFGEYTALDDVSLEIQKGHIFGLLGPNGAGKTTLIRIVNRITIPTAGKVYLDGHLMTDADVRAIGYLPEERGLFKKMKVGEQALYLARLRGLSTGDALSELKKWFIRFGIQSWWDKKVEELSKGMAQKVQFITTVLHKPQLLILDEPFSGFDPVNAQLIRNEILRMRDEGSTIILSTHNMESVEELCDSIALINKSKLVVCGNTDKIRRQWGDTNVEIVYTDADGRHTDVVASGSEGNAALRSILEKGATVNSYSELVPRMNDIFIKLVSEK